jgi:hypothetical protein
VGPERTLEQSAETFMPPGNPKDNAPVQLEEIIEETFDHERKIKEAKSLRAGMKQMVGTHISLGH